MYLVSAAQMRQLDRLTIEQYGTSGRVLMERAGEGALEVMLDQFPHLRKKGARVVVLAGKGNNGGDGFVLARLLRQRGVKTTVALLAAVDDVGGDALRNLKAYRRGRGRMLVVRDADALAALIPELQEAGCVVDAILGTGLRSRVRGFYADAIELVNSCGAPVLALDVPSGLDSDTGAALGTAVQAEATATFGFAKIGQVLYPGSGYCGVLGVVDIGIDERAIAVHPPRARLMEELMVGALLPRRPVDAHKGSCGHLLVIAGSRGKTGAAILATRAALRGGAGLVTLASPASTHLICASAVYEAMTDPWPDRDGSLRFDEDRLVTALDGKAAVVTGPGLGVSVPVRRLVAWLLRESPVPMVLDADALNVLAGRLGPLRRARAGVVLTPHPGEMARLAGITTGAVQADRVGVARGFAETHGCVVVLKGARTVIAAPDGMVWINPTGNPGMASGGMGDVLAGLIGALLAQGLDACDAACGGVFLHGAAGDRVAEAGSVGMIASDLVEHIRAVAQSLAEVV